MAAIHNLSKVSKELTFDVRVNVGVVVSIVLVVDNVDCDDGGVDGGVTLLNIKDEIESSFKVEYSLGSNPFFLHFLL